MSVTIREAKTSDIEAIRRMHAVSWLDTYPNDQHGVSLEWIKEETDSWLTPEALESSKDYLGSRISHPDHFYRIAVDNGKIAGFVHALIEDGQKKVGGFYIDKDYHGTGLAQEMASLADEWLGEATVTLEVVAYNERAIRFYEKWGFSIVQGSDALFKEKIPEVTMRRESKETK